MVFKQNVLKEEKLKLAIFLIPIFFLSLIGILYCLGDSDTADIEALITFLLVFYLPMFLLMLLMLLLGLINLEWFHIYEDSIEVRYIFGKKNIVYFDKVVFVQELKISLTSRGLSKKDFYIFNDGRKNNSHFLDLNSCYNKKKFNLRIYKTDELENYVNNALKLKIKR